MLLDIDALNFSFGDVTVLRDVSFAVQSLDRIGIVGDNGCGKTTLLNLICGELLPQKGSVNTHGCTVGYLKQTAGLSDGTVLQEMKNADGAADILSQMKRLEQTMDGSPEQMERYSQLCAKYDAIGGYDLAYRIRRVLLGMGFSEDDMQKPTGVLSGGEKTRLAMARLLVSSPDIIILDEPTNHLDAASQLWLAQFLTEYGGAVLLVSHDTGFLDKVCTRILEIENHEAKLYSGDYSDFALQKRMNSEAADKAYEQTARQAAKLEDFAKRNMARASTRNMAKSRLKMLERLDTTPPQSHKHERVSFRFTETPLPYKELLTAKGLSIGAGGKPLFRCDDFVLLRGENLAVVGPNGCGKTTFLKTLLRQTRPLEGRIFFGGGVNTAYFEQNVFTDMQKDAISFIWDLYPSMNAQQIRDLLATAGLRGEEVYQPVNTLSGGERARLMLCRLSLLRPNVLILDEPTNHLDIYSREILTDTLKNFFGTVIVVSHDSALVSQLDCRVLAIENAAGRVYESYDAYQKVLAGAGAQRAGYSPKKGGVPEAQQPPKRSSKQQRALSAQRRQRLSELEQEISELEGSIAVAEAQIELPEVACDPQQLSQLCEQMDEQRARLDELMGEWLQLSEDAASEA